MENFIFVKCHKIAVVRTPVAGRYWLRLIVISENKESNLLNLLNAKVAIRLQLRRLMS